MNFERFLREVKAEIEFLYPENLLFGLVLFLTAILRQVLEKDKILAERIVKHLKDMSPLIKMSILLHRDKKYALYALANFKVPEMRGKIKPKRLQNISEEYKDIYKKVKPILKRRYRNPETKLFDLKERLGMNIPKDKLGEWLDYKPSEFACKCLAYKYKYDRHPETILRHVRKERKEKGSTYNLLRKLAEQLSEHVKPQ